MSDTGKVSRNLLQITLPQTTHSRLEAAPTQTWLAPEAGMVCGAKRIRSLYLPWMPGVTPRLSTKASPKGVASLFTINAAITPWRDAFADQTSLPRAIRGRGRWFVHDAG